MVSTGISFESDVTIRGLLEAGLHFGHQTKRWNPKMKRFIFDKRNGIHIIDLAKTLTHLTAAQQFLYDTAVTGKDILFVGTKKQAQSIVKDVATRCDQHYVTTRWLGGTLTNNQTIRRSVNRFREVEKMETDGTFEKLPKKEVSGLRHELAKLRRNLSGIADMVNLPRAIVVVDITREAIAVAEGNRMHIPVVAIVDTNCQPDLIDYPIPGNDDAIRAITLVINQLGNAIQKGAEEYGKAAAEQARRDEEKKQEEAAAAQSRAAAEPKKPTAKKKAAAPEKKTKVKDGDKAKSGKQPPAPKEDAGKPAEPTTKPEKADSDKSS